MAICKLRHRDIRKYEKTGVWPNCLHHHHCSREVANSLVTHNDAFPVPGKSAIVLFDSNYYDWEKVVDQTGTSVLQMRPSVK